MRRFWTAWVGGGGKRAEFTRFLFVGTTNTVSTYLIYLAALFAGVSAVGAYNISYAAGIVISYLLNLKITFRRRHSWKKLLMFPLVYVVQYVAGLVALQFFISLGVPAAIAGLLILAVTVPLTFILSRLFLRR